MAIQSPANGCVVDGLGTSGAYTEADSQAGRDELKMMAGQQPSVQQECQWGCQDDSTIHPVQFDFALKEYQSFRALRSMLAASDYAITYKHTQSNRTEVFDQSPLLLSS